MGAAAVGTAPENRRIAAEHEGALDAHTAWLRFDVHHTGGGLLRRKAGLDRPVAGPEFGQALALRYCVTEDDAANSLEFLARASTRRSSSFFETNPLRLMRELTQEMERFYNAPGAAAGIWSPAIEVKQDGGKFKVTAELPGIKSEDVKVQVTEEALILEGERKTAKEEKGEGFYHSERSYGQFYRSLPLPKGANADKAAAEFKDGVLEITIPVPDSKTKMREIPVKHAA